MKRAKISVVCPLYEAEGDILRLDESLTMQEGVWITEIFYILTEGGDNTEEIMKKAGILERPEVKFSEISKEDFSHSLTREKAAFQATGEVLVFLTQDVEIKDKKFVQKLTEPIVDGEVDATYAKQITKYDNIEKYTRESNYPAKSFTVSKEDVSRLGLKTFFFSDAAGAVARKVFVELGGYDGKDLPISEDMYFAHKLIMSGGKIKYVAEAKVYHSHDFKLSELYNRYRLTGEFRKMTPEIASAGVHAAGGGMAKYIFKRAWQERNFKVLAKFLPNMGARYLGMRRGRK
ncbi:glycosyltransferase family 2 protein [Candidatus Saccharibacteria bacterium]|nr:glycosyltransferase family 2 protein [Candidatus Saccharibacteria bacterium]